MNHQKISHIRLFVTIKHLEWNIHIIYFKISSNFDKKYYFSSILTTHFYNTQYISLFILQTILLNGEKPKSERKKY